MRIKPIKTKKDYTEALTYIETLMAQSPAPNSEKGNQLSILVTLVEKYESEQFPIELPDPIAAITFRMEQKGLTQKDLIPYIGSRSRVSEILSGKRSLTRQMIHNLHSGLNIPLESLSSEPAVFDESGNIQPQYWNNSLVKEMSEKGYFGNSTFSPSNKEHLLREFFSEYELMQKMSAHLRQSRHANISTDKKALLAWSVRVQKKGKGKKNVVKYEKGMIDLAVMKDLAKLSIRENGPIQAMKDLRKKGVIVVIEPHLPRTRLDGAVFMNHGENPIVGLTIRHDRLDNFWFTLMHEIAHIVLHYNDNAPIFYDNADEEDSGDVKEKEANDLAAEALVPEAKWETSAAKITPSPMAIKSLANELGVHESIVAGYTRYKKQNFRYVRDIVNSAKIPPSLFDTEKNKYI